MLLHKVIIFANYFSQKQINNKYSKKVVFNFIDIQKMFMKIKSLPNIFPSGKPFNKTFDQLKC